MKISGWYEVQSVTIKYGRHLAYSDPFRIEKKFRLHMSDFPNKHDLTFLDLLVLLFIA